MKEVLVQELIDYADLEILAGKDGVNRKITDEEITSPGVEFAGFFDYFYPERIILIGSKEAKFIYQMAEDKRASILETLFKKSPAALVFSRNVNVHNMFIDLGNKFNIAILRSDLRTTPLTSKLFTFLRERLAERIGVHGVMMDINGMGTLILGKSGIGKSETALELIKRGHQLISDDLVEIYEKEFGTLVAVAPKTIMGFLEVRGVGIINVIETFGIEAFRTDKTIRLVIELEEWQDSFEYDRLGLEEKSITYFNTELPKLTIPVKTGRNIAVVIEAAAMNQKLKYMGYNSAFDLTKNVNNVIKGGE